MEITLTPTELYQVNSIQSKNTIRVLPKGKHKQSKVVVGDSNEAAYALTIEVPIPLEYLIVSASIHVDIIPDPEYNNIISETPITKQSQKLLATIRLPQDDGSYHRTKVKFRAVEGQHGELCVYVVGRTGTEK